MSSFGEELKRERELRRITLREVSEATKITLRYLEALENNDFEHLPGGVFNRGFVRAYAQFIGVDPEAMVEAYLLEEKSQTEHEADAAGNGGSALRRTEGSAQVPLAPAAGTPNALKWGLVVALVVVVVGGGLYWFLMRSGDDAEAAAEPPARSEPLERPASEAGEPAAVDDGSAEDDAAADDDPTPADPPADETDDGGSSDEPLLASSARPAAAIADRPTSPPATREPAETQSRTATPTATPADREPTANQTSQPRTTPPIPAPSETSPPAATAPASTQAPVLVEIHVDQATIGRLNCDNQRIEMLEGVRPGTTLRMRCRNFLIVDAADGSALRASVAGGPASGPLGPAGRLNGHRINLSSAGGPKDEDGHE